ncbi:hypothetical protein [Aneurinibacillus soli]|nr:hypothetical protein [Aneurinibacillus soli]
MKNNEAVFQKATGYRTNPFWRRAVFVNRNAVRGVGEGQSKRVPVRAYPAEGERRTGLCPQSFGESTSEAFLTISQVNHNDFE